MAYMECLGILNHGRQSAVCIMVWYTCRVLDHDHPSGSKIAKNWGPLLLVALHSPQNRMNFCDACFSPLGPLNSLTPLSDRRSKPLVPKKAVLLSSIQATQANEIIHGLDETTSSGINGRHFILLLPELLHNIGLMQSSSVE